MRNNRLYRFYAFLAFMILILFALAPPVYAFESRGGDTVVIPADETIDDDLYVTAGSFLLQGTVQGDLIVLGGTIEIEGAVEGDILAAGQSVVITGQVSDDARLAGYVISLGEGVQIDDDLIGAAYSLQTEPGSVVGGEIVYAGYQALLGGEAGGDVRVASSGLQVSGIVGGDLRADVGDVQDPQPFPPFTFMPDMPEVSTIPPGLLIFPSAQITGDLFYTSDARVDIPQSVVAGEVTYDQPPQPEEDPAETGAIGWFLDSFRQWLALFLVGLLVLWLFPVMARRSAAILGDRPLPSLGWGLVVFIAAFFVLLLIIFVTVLFALIFGWITLGNLTALVIVFGLLALFAFVAIFIFAVVYASKILVAYFSGRWILGRVNPSLANNRVLPLLLGLILVVILTAIPWVGWLFNLLVVLLGLGALWILILEAFRPARTAA